MSGYNFSEGMSNNAVDAYYRGVKPISKITTQDLKGSGADIPKNVAVWLAKNNYWRPCEWHHSGGQWFNAVDFYDPRDLADAINSGKIDLTVLQAQFRAEQKPATVAEQGKVAGSYVIWGGTRRRPRRVGEQKFTGVKKGNWIFLDDGGKKKADGNYIFWEKIA